MMIEVQKMEEGKQLMVSARKGMQCKGVAWFGSVPYDMV